MVTKYGLPESYLDAWAIKPGENQYQCAKCGGIFNKGWSEEEANKEYETIFPENVGEPRVVVCDDCWKEEGFA